MSARRRGSLRLTIAAVIWLTCIPATGCVPVWHEADPASAVAERPDSVRATTLSGDRWVLAAPHMQDDSLIGYTWVEGEGGARVALPALSVGKIETFDRTGRQVTAAALSLALLAASLAIE